MTEDFVLCMKYGTRYPADYVNVLYNASRKALRRPTRFVCLTDDATGILPEVEVLPIPDIGLTKETFFRPGVWPKVSLYVADLHGLRGRALFIDLDMVIVGDLDAFFDHPGDVIGTNASPSWGKGNQENESTEFGSMVFAYTIGSHPEIVTRFQAEREAVWQSFPTEQAFVHGCLPGVAFWPEAWVASFKRTLRQPIGLDLFLDPRTPAPPLKILSFHGKPRPIDLIRGRPYFWDRFPHMGHGRVEWMSDYWLENGGTLPR